MSEKKPEEAPGYQGSSPSTVADVRKWSFVQALKANAITGGVSIVAVFVAGWTAFATVDHAADAAADKRVAPLEARIDATRAADHERLTAHIADEAERHAQQVQALNTVLVEVRGMREDQRETYRSSRTGQRSERLEAPLPPLVDAGHVP